MNRGKASFRIRFGDTDPWGVAYYAAFFRYANQAVEDYLCGLLNKPVFRVWRDEEEGYGLPVVDAKGSFLKPVRYGEVVEVSVGLKERRNKGVSFLCSFAKDGEVVARVELVCVCIDRHWRSRALPSGFEGERGGEGDA